MKSIIARATLLGFCFYLLIGFVDKQAHGGEYYIYRDSKGELVLSNQKPPPGSNIIKQQIVPDSADTETPPLNDGKDKRK